MQPDNADNVLFVLFVLLLVRFGSGLSADPTSISRATGCFCAASVLYSDIVFGRKRDFVFVLFAVEPCASSNAIFSADVHGPEQQSPENNFIAAQMAPAGTGTSSLVHVNESALHLLRQFSRSPLQGRRFLLWPQHMSCLWQH